MNWLKKNYRIILLVSIPVLLLADILTRYFFILHLEFDSTLFNNVLTPIGTVIGTILFAGALYLSIKQNRIIISQNLKSHIDREFERVRTSLARPINTIQHHEEVTLLNISSYLNDLWMDIHTLDYNKDLEDYKKGVRHTRSYFTARDYYKTLSKLYDVSWTFNYFNTLIRLIGLIDIAGLHETDIALYKRRINTEFIGMLRLTLIDIFENKGFIVPRLERILADTEEIIFDDFADSMMITTLKIFDTLLGSHII